jgi:type IV secretory pathway VirB10-like protein
MKIKRSVLERMIKEALAAHVARLTEAPKKPSEPGIEDADKEKKKPDQAKEKDVKKDAPPDKPKSKEDPTAPADQSVAPELPTEDEPADKELDKDVAKKDAGEVEDAEDVTGGEIADEIAGKTVQSITMEPKSKIMPGAQEIVITFDQIPDPLRILINKSGVVKFYYKGLHNEL